MRVDLSLSGRISGEAATLEALELHLYGSEKSLGTSPQDSFELFWGEEGLECAVAGRVSHVECNLDSYRVPLSFDASAAGDGGLSGRELHYVARGPAPLVPPPVVLRGSEGSASFPATGRVYLTRLTRNGRVALAGFDLTPSDSVPGETRWARRTQYPVGENILADISEMLAPRPDEPWEPATSCAGLPHNVRLPLEDELSEAVTGSDDIESSFAHYLSLARTAAKEADDLAETLIRDGLEIDLRAETARDALEETCGQVVNVPSFRAAAGGSSCSSGADCPPNTFCLGDVCTSGELESVLPDDRDKGEQLRECIGADQGDKVIATLGSEPMCVFQKEGLPPCTCAEGDSSDDSPCPVCPAPKEDSDGNTCAIAAAGPFRNLDGKSGYEVRETAPLFVVDREESGGGAPPQLPGVGAFAPPVSPRGGRRSSQERAGCRRARPVGQDNPTGVAQFRVLLEFCRRPQAQPPAGVARLTRTEQRFVVFDRKSAERRHQELPVPTPRLRTGSRGARLQPGLERLAARALAPVRT